jgi:endonuclease I
MLPDIDEDLTNSNNMILFYTGQSIVKSQDLNNDWNREHVWPKSLGWFEETYAGSDLHHIRPCKPSVNSSRGNKKFGTTTNGNYYCPDDAYKGDVARIIFYLMVAYNEADKYSFTSVAQSLTMLLDWNELDPVSEAEIVRNDKIEVIQGNRNPFIDYPELADQIW